MEWCYKYILQYILLNDDDQAVSIERFKMMANGLRIIALAILAAAIIAPLFNPALKPRFLARVGGGVVAGLIEILALRFKAGLNSGAMIAAARIARAII